MKVPLVVVAILGHIPSMNQSADGQKLGVVRSAGLSLFSTSGCWLWILLAPVSLPGADNGKETVFRLREVSVFDRQQSDFLRGQTGECKDQPYPEVQTYPAFKSGKPIYGLVRFAGEYGDLGSGQRYHFVLDESQGTGKGYDRLYFDLNQDLDLRNDAVLLPQKRPPDGSSLPYGNVKEQNIYDWLVVPFDFGPEGKRSVQLMPRLTITTYEQKDYPQVTFVRTRMFEGEIQIAGRGYRAFLGNDYLITGRFDQPGTALVLEPQDQPGRRNSWWGGDRLMAIHQIKGTFYRFAASPKGDQLTVQPYRGDLGTFEVSAGGRTAAKLDVTGSLQARDKTVAVGGDSPEGLPQAVRSCELPVGDYLPSYLTINLGRLRLTTSHNYHADGQPRDRGGRPLVYGMAVRKEAPFKLDFTTRPEVLFAQPAKAQHFKRGGTVEVKAVLVDPKLDIMIRGLEDTSRKQTQENKQPDGKSYSYERNLSLDPKVIITRTNGDQVAEGVMPFG